MKLHGRQFAIVLTLALGTIVGVATLARADVAATFQVTFGKSPHWVGVQGTKVKEIRQGERPDYDIFKCGGRYYVHNADGWYCSKKSHGDFAKIEETAVPRDLARVPRDHWKNYPAGWTEPPMEEKHHGKGYH